MTILGNKNTYLEEDSQEEQFTLPAVTRKERNEGVSFEKSLLISLILHPATFGGVLLITLILALMGIHLTMFQKPEFKKDIEFVLVQNEGTPRNPNTRNRADMNSRSGGVNDPKRPVSMPSAAGPAQKPSPAAAAPKPKSKPSTPAPQKVSKPVQQQKPVQKQVQKPVQQPAAKPSPAKPAPPTPAPSPMPMAAPKPVAKPSSAFTVPVPPKAPIGKTLATGPVSGTGTSSGAKTSGGPVTTAGLGSTFAPAPSLSPSQGRSSGGSGQLGRSSGGGGYNAGNPGGGGGALGIDALREPDFGPYMRELQRKIKLNWDPPKGNESKRVVLLFKIAKDGRLLSCRVYKSSGLQSADTAALKAVELTAPFKPLPADYRGQSIDIQFTFDYNVFGASRY